MKDAQGNLVQGRTRWRRFAAVAIPAAAAAGAIVFGMANGAIAASFNVSGQQFKVSADKLVAKGFVQYGGVVNSQATEKNGGKIATIPVATAGMSEAWLTNLCQSVKVPDLPVSMVIRAGGDVNNPAHATNLLIDMSDLTGDATFTNINIGQDAGSLNAAGPSAHGAIGGFGQQATDATILNVKQKAWSTAAGSFELHGLHMFVDINPAGPQECFPG